VPAWLASIELVDDIASAAHRLASLGSELDRSRSLRNVL
jgi:hypothetical protein